MSTKSGLLNKWVLLLTGALIVYGVLAITFMIHDARHANAPVSSTTATNQRAGLSEEDVKVLLQIYSKPPNPLDGIEAAERHNLLEMKRRLREVRRSMQSVPD